jgi:hypothetical protein
MSAISPKAEVKFRALAASLDDATVDVIQASKPEPRIPCCEFSEHEWTAIKPMLPNKPRAVRRVYTRRVLVGIVWVLLSGAPWRDLPATIVAARLVTIGG